MRCFVQNVRVYYVQNLGAKSVSNFNITIIFLIYLIAKGYFVQNIRAFFVQNLRDVFVHNLGDASIRKFELTILYLTYLNAWE